MIKETTYKCSICGQKFKTAKDAVKCESVNNKPEFKVYDLVDITEYDHDYEGRGHFQGYGVITEVHQDGHKFTYKAERMLSTCGGAFYSGTDICFSKVKAKDVMQKCQTYINQATVELAHWEAEMNKLKQFQLKEAKD